MASSYRHGWPDSPESASSALAPCLHSAYELFVAHTEGKLGAFDMRTVTTRASDGSGTVDQQFQVAVSRLPGKVLVNDYFGVTELRRADITQIK